jgi:hypothetical protein
MKLKIKIDNNIIYFYFFNITIMTLIETLLITINVIYINYYEFNIYRSFIILLNFYRIIILENTNKRNK